MTALPNTPAPVPRAEVIYVAFVIHDSNGVVLYSGRATTDTIAAMETAIVSAGASIVQGASAPVGATVDPTGTVTKPPVVSPATETAAASNAELLAQITAIRDEVTALQSALADERADLIAQSGEIAALQQMQAAYAGQVQILVDRQASALARVAVLEAEEVQDDAAIAAAKAEADATATALGLVQSALTGAQASLKAATDALAIQAAKTSDLNTALAAQAVALAAVTGRIATAEASLGTLGARVAALEAHLPIFNAALKTDGTGSVTWVFGRDFGITPFVSWQVGPAADGNPVMIVVTAITPLSVTFRAYKVVNGLLPTVGQALNVAQPALNYPFTARAEARQ